MKYIKILILGLLLTSCGIEAEKYSSENIVANINCEVYEPTTMAFSGENEKKFRLKVVLFGSATIEHEKFLEVVNEDFSSNKISFHIENPKSDIYYKPISDTVYYRDILQDNFNFGYITMLVFPKGIHLKEERLGTIQGAALGIPEIYNPSLGKPVFFIRQEKLYTAIVTHELGHVFGLHHLFKDHDVVNKGYNCDSGDKVKDTPFVNVQGVGSKSCRAYLPIGWEDIHTEEEVQESVENFLSYSPDLCMKSFSQGQNNRVNKGLEGNALLQAALIK